MHDSPKVVLYVESDVRTGTNPRCFRNIKRVKVIVEIAFFTNFDFAFYDVFQLFVKLHNKVTNLFMTHVH
jgi:hypothetical protein